MEKTFRIHLEAHPLKKSNENAIIDLCYIDTDRMVNRGDIIDLKSFYQPCEWQLWQVVDIIHHEKGTVALLEFIPNLVIDFIFADPQ